MAKARLAHRAHKQKGATLIVSLILLAVITVLGIASMRSSNLELRMAASARDRSIAFQAAETALLQVEKDVIGVGTTPPQFGINNVIPSCGADCFTDACNNGLCFSGDFTNAQNYSDCKLTQTDGTLVQPWQSKALWEDDTKYRTIQVPSNDPDLASNEVKYIIEFICFAPVETTVDSPTSGSGEIPHTPLFRITTNASGESGRSSVMLQSVVQTPI